MVVAESIGEACSLMDSARPRVVVIHFKDDCAGYEEIDQLLWTISVLAR